MISFSSFFRLTITLLLFLGHPPWREDGSVVYSAITGWSGHWGPITTLYHLIWDYVPFLSPRTTRRDYGGGILTRLHTRSHAFSCAHLGPVTNFAFSLKFLLDSCGFVILKRPLWREDGSVNYCKLRLGLARALLGRSPAELTALFYCLIWDSTNLEGQSPYFEVTLVQCEISNATIGRAAWEACSATWNLGTNSAFALGPRKTMVFQFSGLGCAGPHYVSSAQTTQNAPLSTVLLLHVDLLLWKWVYCAVA
jgi:hypothetical protein